MRGVAFDIVTVAATKVTAPAHSPPIRSSIAQSWRALMPGLRAMISRFDSSGKIPAKYPLHSLRLNRRVRKGRDWDRGVAPGLFSQLST